MLVLTCLSNTPRWSALMPETVYAAQMLVVFDASWMPVHCGSQ